MKLLTGAYVTLSPFDTKILRPNIFSEQREVSSYVRNEYQRILIDRGVSKDKPISDEWETGISIDDYRLYAEKSGNGITYNLRSDSLHVVYRVDDIMCDNNALNIEDTNQNTNVLYWSNTSSPAITLAIRMAKISGYATGKNIGNDGNTMSKEDIAKTIPSEDPVTMMFVIYTMLRTDDKDAYFYVQDGYLSLHSKDGFITTGDKVENVDDGVFCDPYSIYSFSPMYKDIPDNVDSAIDMFRDRIKTDSEDKLRNLLNDALLPGIQWRDKVTEMMKLLNIDQNSIDNVIYTLMRIVAKIKLIKGATIIFNGYPCSVPK